MTSSSVAEILQQVSESTTASHRKHATNLYKLSQKAFSSKSSSSANQFQHDFLQCIYHVLQSKKEASSGTEKVFKFLSTYFTTFAKSNAESTSEKNEMADFYSTVLMEKLLLGSAVQNKVVRFRSCQLISILMNSLDEVNDDVFEEVKETVLERCSDKEALVRLHASNALSRLQDCASEEELPTIYKKLLFLLQKDPSCDIRKTVLANIDVNESTIDGILSRSRDIDAGVRKMLYKKMETDFPGDFNINTRWENIVQFLGHGLNDRDPAVKTQCRSLCNSWFSTNVKLMEFLKMIDLKSCSDDHTVIMIIHDFFAQNPDFSLKNEEIDWETLSTQGALMIRVYCDYCYTKSMDQDRIDSLVPTLTEWVDLIGSYKELLLTPRLSPENQAPLEPIDDDEKEVVEFILEQLLKTVQYLNLSDESGRQKLLSMLRDFLEKTDIPEENMKVIISLMKQLATDVDDFIRMIMEVNCAILDLNPESNNCEDDEEAVIAHQIAVFKVLEIIRVVFASCQQFSTSSNVIYDIVEPQIFPAVASDRSAIKKMGIECLALYSLSDQIFGQENFDMFLQCSRSGKKSLVTLALKFLFDWTLLFGLKSLEPEQIEGMISFFRDSLESQDEATLCLAVEGTAKCLIWDRLTAANADHHCDDLLLALVVLYFHPQTAQIHRLRQCLSYFFTSFSRSAFAHQKMIHKVFFPSLLALAEVGVDDSAPAATAIPLLKIATQMLEWTNINNLITNSSSTNSSVMNSDSTAFNLHNGLVLEGLELAIQQSLTFRKLICQMLGKVDVQVNIHNSGEMRRKCTQLKTVMRDDATCRRQLEKFVSSRLDAFDELEKARLEGEPVTSSSHDEKDIDGMQSLANSDDEGVAEGVSRIALTSP